MNNKEDKNRMRVDLRHLHGGMVLHTSMRASSRMMVPEPEEAIHEYELVEAMHASQNPAVARWGGILSARSGEEFGYGRGD